MNTQEIHSVLTKKGLRPTQQRMAVYAFLLSHPIHPTAETIYRELTKAYPSFSRATVYNSLHKLAEAGLIKVLTIDAEEHRFDGNAEEHGHFQCTRCGEVVDFSVDFETMALPSPPGAEVISREVFCTGLCADCRTLS